MTLETLKRIVFHPKTNNKRNIPIDSILCSILQKKKYLQSKHSNTHTGTMSKYLLYGYSRFSKKL